MMKASDYIAHFLYEQGITHVYELVGGMIVHILDSINRHGNIRIISMHHEQGAAFAADAYGRMTGKPGVALATSGPGATNLLTGIGSCYFDSSPAVFITGQVNRYELKGNSPIRQLGFQETDIVSMARPITKAAWQVKEAEELPTLLQQAFSLAVSGRPGPVLIDIPMDIQRAEITPPSLKHHQSKPKISPHIDYDLLFQKLMEAKRPLILAGGGIRAAQAVDLLRAFASYVKVPVVNSLMGVDAMPYDDPFRIGLIGSYGNRWANMAIGKSDFMIVLGSRLDIRQTGAKTEEFKGERTIFHIDCESAEVNNRVKGCHAIIADVKDFLSSALEASTNFDFSMREAWHKEIANLRAQWPDTAEIQDVPGINPNKLMHIISQEGKTAGAGVYVVDVGQHQMWAAQSIEINSEQRFLTSGGMGSMGFALPAAIGAACIVAPRPVVVIAGDGGFQCNIQELQTVIRNQLPIKIIVVNNGAHGMVRQFQESYFESRYQSTVWGYDAPDFTKVAQGYGMEARKINSEAEVKLALEWLFRENVQGPGLLEIMIDPAANAYPKIAFGRPIDQMEPLYNPIEMEST